MTSFLTIVEVAAGADEGEIDLLAAGADYPDLMTEAGFDDVDVADVTDEYETTLTAWIREWDAERADLERLVGADAFAERRTHRMEDLQAIRAGRRRRFLVTGTSS